MKTQKKRKQERKTSYKKRFGMLKSGKGRVVIRKTNRYLIIQYVQSQESKDKVIFGISSKELLNKGWPKEIKGSLKNISASYITGYLFGKKGLENGLNGGILDIGLQRNIAGGKIYSALNGIVDSGFYISHDKKVFPKKERIEGENLKGDVKKVVKKLLGGLK